jgi:hypothetical protein
MTGIIPRETVPAPPVASLRYGLFNAAWQTVDAPPHVRAGGVQFQPDSCGVAKLYTAECPITDQDLKDLAATPVTMTGDPFIAYASVLCAPTGWTADEQRTKAINKLLATEQTQVESALWNGGGVGALPALTGAGAATVTTTATSIEGRVAALEAEFYAAYGRQGTIHVNTRAMGNAATNHLIERPSVPPEVPSIAVTPLGSRWSFGAGYGITGPADAAPAAGSVWAFMTPPVTIWRSNEVFAPDPNETFNRITNQRYAIAERFYTVAYECPTVFAVELPVENP